MSVIPDSIEPVEGYRTWKFNGKALVSVTNETVWPTKDALEAKCSPNSTTSMMSMYMTPRFYHWDVRKDREGLTYDQAFAQHTSYVNTGFYVLAAPPKTLLPDGFSLHMIEMGGASSDHGDCPGEGCSCGIYAASELGGCPAAGRDEIMGKVKMWGKVVPGDKGWRAQYAFPSELYVPERLSSHPALLAYGVPITALPEMPKDADAKERIKISNTRKYMLGATVINLGCAALNLSEVFHIL